MSKMAEFVAQNERILVGFATISALFLLLAAVALPVAITRIPADYFVRPPSANHWATRHPLCAITIGIIRNLLGGSLVIAGILMLVLPGQGLLTILAGLMVMTFPGKRRFELLILKRPLIRRMVDHIRRRFDKPPLQLPNSESTTSSATNSGKKANPSADSANTNPTHANLN